MVAGGAEEQVPHLVDLPFACDSEYDEVLYWHKPKGATDARCVRLTKHEQLITFDMWLPVRFWQPLPGINKDLELQDDELRRIVLKAYEAIKAKQRDDRKPFTVHVRAQGYPNGINVRMELSVYHYKQPVWRDEEGRVW